MCGIFFIAGESSTVPFYISPTVLAAINRRGPNWNGFSSSSGSSGSCGSLPVFSHSATTDDAESIENDRKNEKLSENRINFFLYASVLQLRGEDLVKQPLKDDLGNLLAWNGELFGANFSNDESDTLIISNQLRACEGDEEGIFRVLNCGTEGPFAFVYFDVLKNAIFFGRDRCGRRSLIWMTTPDGSFVLSSVLPVDLNSGDPGNYGEISPHGLFKMKKKNGKFVFSFRPWTSSWDDNDSDLNDEDLSRFTAVNETFLHTKTVVPVQTKHPKEQLDDYAAPPTGTSPMDYLDDYATPPTGTSPMDYLDELLREENVKALVEKFKNVFCQSVKLRCELTVSWCKNCEKKCSHTKIAVLFSGGIDSLAIAYLAHFYIPLTDPIDLINVAFVPDDRPTAAAAAPDRISGLAGFQFLAEKFPERRWNMVIIDVKKSEADETRQSNLWQLIAPQSTVLDCSLGTVLWFAARGKGELKKNSKEESEKNSKNEFEKNSKSEFGENSVYESPARVVFSGLGADELLGGYSRHRTKFQSGGEKRLEEEMKMDLRRIGNRNCGRDDRVISDHGREARYPFLDENLVNFLMNLPVRLRCRLDLQRGLGEKILLRLLLRQLGFGDFALLEKRAMQFGSRIAKIDQTKNGSDIIFPLLTKIPDR